MKWYLLAGWACLALAACSSPESNFEDAKEQGTAEAYLAFLEKYPDHELAGQAKIEAMRLEWDDIQDAADPAVFSDYTDRYPDSEFQAEAATRVETLEFDVARDLDEPERWRAFLGRFPGSRFEADAVDALLSTCDTGAGLRHEETIAAGSGFMESAPDGTIKNYPEGTTLSLSITDNQNGTTYQTSGSFLTMVEEYALFELENGHFYVRLPSGYLAPCFCPGFVPATSDQAAAAEQVYARWRLQRLEELIAFVKNNAGTEGREEISIMGALQIPHARREIAALQDSGSEHTVDLARHSAEISRTIAARTCPSP